MPGVGPSQGSLMSRGMPTDTENGTPVSRARPDILREMANAGGGVFARGEDPSGLASFLEEAQGWGSSEESVSWQTVAVDGWPLFLGLAVGALFLEMVLGTPHPGVTRPSFGLGQVDDLK